MASRGVTRRRGRNTKWNQFHLKGTPNRLQDLPNAIARRVSDLKECVRMAGISGVERAQTFHFGRIGRIMARRGEEKIAPEPERKLTQ
ncbi:hypothetical protein BDI4_840007 [Burkholderia diffusa]|nr:hypothetical protein BDI4_840007 [Burkholderia diffusa]